MTKLTTTQEEQSSFTQLGDALCPVLSVLFQRITVVTERAIEASELATSKMYATKLGIWLRSMEIALVAAISAKKPTTPT